MSRNKLDFKFKCDRVEAHDKVTNKEELLAALPDVFAVVDAIKSMNVLIKMGNKIVKKAFAMCSAYALKHPSLFDDDGLREKEQSVLTGTITVDGEKYHFVHGYDGYDRADGSNKNQEYLNSLPSEWVRSKLELDTTGIDRAGTSEEELEKFGLKRKVTNVWTKAE